MSTSPDLPLEILDLIVDYLHAERSTLNACFIVSKSWVPRARTHLFVRVEFNSGSAYRWKELFPEPSTSPAHHTRVLRFHNFQTMWIAGDITPDLIRSFCHIVDLDVTMMPEWDGNRASLLSLHGLSPTLKSLTLRSVSLTLSDIMSFICSFPLLENLGLHHLRLSGDTDGWDTPSTSPKLTGTLRLYDSEDPFIPRGLLSLPNGPRFSKIALQWPVEVAEATMELVSKCSNTLESLSLEYRSFGVLSLVSVFS